MPTQSWKARPGGHNIIIMLFQDPHRQDYTARRAGRIIRTWVGDGRSGTGRQAPQERYRALRPPRSEERRVGKEWRSRGWRYDCKKKDGIGGVGDACAQM